jgi:ankyrin repeat protein
MLAQCIFCLTALTLAQGAESDPEKLYTVIRAGDPAGLKTLLDRGSDANAKDSREISPLMYAAEVGSAAEMRVLLEHHADVNAQNAFGSTALMWSVSDVQKVRLLLDHGADVNLVAKTGNTALLIALARPNPEAARLLMAKGADTAAVNKRGVTALLAATDGNDTATIRVLVEAGADVNQADILGNTPLMNAAGNGNLSAVKLLLARGAKVNAVAPASTAKINNRPLVFGGFTPLILAATYGPPEVVRTLLDAGADVNAAEARGMTPLMLSLTTDRLNPEITKILLEHNADTKMKSLEGETALDWACKYGVPNTIEALGGKPRSAPESPASASQAPGAVPDLRIAIERSTGLLAKTSAEFFVQGACYACHAHTPAHIAAAVARANGIHVDEAAASERQKQMTSGLLSRGPTLTMEGAAFDTAFYTL